MFFLISAALSPIKSSYFSKFALSFAVASDSPFPLIIMILSFSSSLRPSHHGSTTLSISRSRIWHWIKRCCWSLPFTSPVTRLISVGTSSTMKRRSLPSLSPIWKNVLRGSRPVTVNLPSWMGNFTLCPCGAHGNVATLSLLLVVVPVMTKSMLSSTTGVNVCACPTIVTRASRMVMMVFLFTFISFLFEFLF